MARFRKNCISLLLTAALALQLCTTALATRAVENATVRYRGIHITVNGTQIHPCDAAGKAVEPFILDGTTYLPVRAVADALGLTVEWDAASSTVTLHQGGQVNYGGETAATSDGTKTVPLVYRDIRLVIDGKPVVPTDVNGIPTEPFIIDGATYLPVRAVADALGLTVGWDDASSTVTLDAPVPKEPRFLLTQETEETRTGEGFATKTYKTMKTYLYDSNGNCTEMTLYSPDGTVTIRYTYDVAGRLRRQSSTEKNTVITYTYSASGMLLREKRSSDEGTISFEYTYDSADRVTHYIETHTRSDGTVLNEGVSTVYRYDTKGRLLETASSWSGGRSNEQLEYDEAGNVVTRITTTNHLTEKWSLTYDKRGNLLSEICADGKKQNSYTYDAEGNQISCVSIHDGMIDTVVYTYKNGRMTACVYAWGDGASEAQEWSYSPEGELLTESYNSSKGGAYTVTHVRSSDGCQLRSVKSYAAGRTETDVTTYDEYGNVIAKEHSEPGLWSRYTYEFSAQ